MLGIEPVPRAPLPEYSAGIQQRRFYPYEDNHGSSVAIAGEDFAIIASDTRLSGSGYNILTRNQSKLFQLSEQTVLASTGCWCDILTFTRIAEARMKIYKNTHNKDMKTGAVAQMVSTMLYGKRFFPYYISNIIAGLDEEGKGVVYSYDPVGHVEKHTYRAGGSSVSLLQPLMDNQVGKKNMAGADMTKKMTQEEAYKLVHDLFISAAEREIHTGDSIAFKIITKDGIQEKFVELRRD